MTLRSSHTHLQTATCQRPDQSLQKSVPARPKKKFIFFLPTLRCFNFFAITQPATDKQSDSLFQTLTGQFKLTRTEEARTANMGNRCTTQFKIGKAAFIKRF